MTRTSPASYAWRLLPVVIAAGLAAAWCYQVEPDSQYRLRNLVPPALVILLSLAAIVRGGGRWTGAGWAFPLGTLGFAIPAIGLAVYLHYAYAVNLDGLFDAGPGQLFRFLPIYTVLAGAIGFAIGWIVGRGV